MKRQTLAQKKALRSAAAKKGWMTRRMHKQYLEMRRIMGVAQMPEMGLDQEKAIQHLAGSLPPPDPNRSRLAARLKSLWQHITGWLR